MQEQIRAVYEYDDKQRLTKIINPNMDDELNFGNKGYLSRMESIYDYNHNGKIFKEINYVKGTPMLRKYIKINTDDNVELDYGTDFNSISQQLNYHFYNMKIDEAKKYFCSFLVGKRTAFENENTIDNTEFDNPELQSLFSESVINARESYKKNVKKFFNTVLPKVHAKSDMFDEIIVSMNTPGLIKEEEFNRHIWEQYGYPFRITFVINYNDQQHTEDFDYNVSNVIKTCKSYENEDELKQNIIRQRSMKVKKIHISVAFNLYYFEDRVTVTYYGESLDESKFIGDKRFGHLMCDYIEKIIEGKQSKFRIISQQQLIKSDDKPDKMFIINSFNVDRELENPIYNQVSKYSYLDQNHYYPSAYYFDYKPEHIICEVADIDKNANDPYELKYHFEYANYYGNSDDGKSIFSVIDYDCNDTVINKVDTLRGKFNYSHQELSKDGNTISQCNYTSKSSGKSMNPKDIDIFKNTYADAECTKIIKTEYLNNNCQKTTINVEYDENGQRVKEISQFTKVN